MSTLTSRDDIRAELIEIKQEAPADIDRALHEYTDSLLPVYSGEIVDEWRDMPSHYDNTGREEFGTSGTETITELMTLDLWLYYSDLVTEVWRELTEEESTEEEGN